MDFLRGFACFIEIIRYLIFSLVSSRCFSPLAFAVTFKFLFKFAHFCFEVWISSIIVIWASFQTTTTMRGRLIGASWLKRTSKFFAKDISRRKCDIFLFGATPLIRCRGFLPLIEFLLDHSELFINFTTR